MTSMYYVLNPDHSIREVSDVIEWGKFYNSVDARRVAQTEVGNLNVSTVFLGIDHRFGDGPPLLFETMIFGHPDERYEYQERYSTWDEAVAGHEKAVKEAEELIKKL